MESAGNTISTAAIKRPDSWLGAAALFKKIRGLYRGQALAAADQCVVSGTSFCTFLLVARSTTREEVGSFALTISIFGVLLVLQHAVIATPYFVQQHGSDANRTDRAFAALVSSSALCAISLFAAAVLGVANACPPSVALAVSVTAPALILKELVRDMDFAHLNLRRAALLDVSAAFLQLSALACLYFLHALSAASALWSMAGGSGVAAAVALYGRRAEFFGSKERLPELLRESWALGKWLLVSRFFVSVQGYAALWISFVFAGPGVTGVYAACASLAALANPFIFGLYNFFAPRAALVLKKAGQAALLDCAVRDMLLLALIVVPFPVALTVLGPTLLEFAYPKLQDQSAVVVLCLLTTASTALAIGLPAASALTILQRGRTVATLSFVGAAGTTILGCLLIPLAGLVGAGAAALGGAAFVTLTRWTILFRLVGRNPFELVRKSPYSASR